MNYEYQYDQKLSRKLLDCVFSFSISENTPSRKDLIVPDCTPGLIYVCKGDFNRLSNNGQSTLKEGKLYLIGQKTKTVEYSFQGSDIEARGFKLAPHSIFKLFGFPASEITDKAIELDRSFESDKITEMIMQNTYDKFNIFDGEQSSDLLNLTIDDIHKSNGLIKINELLYKYNIGYKKLERIFKLHTGITPKLYTRITRFNYSLKLGMTSNYSLTDLAFQSGFFDQNHFIKEVKRFCDKPPGKIVNPKKSILEPDHINYLMHRNY